MAADDVYSRLNFLYHTVEQLNSNGFQKNVSLIHYYCKCFAEIAKKRVLRVEPAMRRRMCKKCFMILIPGVTATIRFRSKRQKHKVVTCSVCKSIRRFNTKADPFATLSMDEMPHGSKDSVNVFLAPPTLTCNSINEHNPNSGKKGKKRRR